jgi:hypothetical protein
MRQPFTRTLVVLAIAAVVVLLCAPVLIWRLAGSPFGADDGKRLSPPDGPVFATKTRAYTLRPLRRDEVEGRLLPAELPAEATNIRFAERSEWVAYIMFASFEAPPETCRAYATRVLDEYNRQRRGTTVPSELWPVGKPPDNAVARLDFPAPPEMGKSEGLPVEWFRPENITSGFEGGDRPRVWVDMERGVFYYFTAD